MMRTAAFLLAFALATPAYANHFEVIHDFTGGSDGFDPTFTLIASDNGHFLGAAMGGGQHNSGVVFRLKPQDDAWAFKTIYAFKSKQGQPQWGLTRVGDRIYANAGYASVFGGPCGTLLQLNPAVQEQRGMRSGAKIHTYVSKKEGCPSGNLVRLKDGSLAGVTEFGGTYGYGSIVQFVEQSDQWIENVLYSFTGNDDGGSPMGSLITDKGGNLYATTYACASGCFGTVVRLQQSAGQWTLETLHRFQGKVDGGYPIAGLVQGREGQLYGATSSFGVGGGGTVFELMPSQGKWVYTKLAQMSGTNGPHAALALNARGDLYGSNFGNGAYRLGSVFRLVQRKGAWHYEVLHDFTGGADGGSPEGGIAFDPAGNVLGMAEQGGAQNAGVIYKITMR